MFIFLSIVFLSILVLVHESGHFLMAKKFSVPVDEFGIGYPPKIYGLKKGGTEYSINAIPFGGFNRINPEILEKQGVWKKIFIYSGGIIFNLIFGLLILTLVYMAGSKPALIVTQIAKNSPAAKVFKVQDQIISLECQGEKISSPFKASQMKSFISKHKGEKMSIEVNRKGKFLSFSITPRLKYPSGQGALGIGFVDIGLKKMGLIKAIGWSLKDTYIIFKGTFSALSKLLIQIFYQPKIIKNFMGPVGAIYYSSFMGIIGWVYFFKMMGIISISLAAINLFPFPALDGMYLVYILIERIKGASISLKIKEKINTFGFVFLLILGLVILVKDILMIV